MTTKGTIDRVQRGTYACICLPAWMKNESPAETNFSKMDVWTSDNTGDVLIAEVPVFF